MSLVLSQPKLRNVHIQLTKKRFNLPQPFRIAGHFLIPIITSVRDCVHAYVNVTVQR